MADQNSPAPGRIGWCDLTVADADRVRDFYARVVGWEPEAVPMGDYSDWALKVPGGGEAVAGICHARGPNRDLPPVWMLYVVVEDLDHSLERCREGGGTVLVEPRVLGAQGRYAVIRDPAGAALALWESAAD